jgi:PAS domain S-box-containing protein
MHTSSCVATDPSPTGAIGSGGGRRYRRAVLDSMAGQCLVRIASALVGSMGRSATVPPLRAGNRITGAISVWHDVTPFERTREALRTSNEKLRLAHERFTAALQASPVVVFTQDRDLRYTWIHNPALGYRAEEVVGKTDHDIFERSEDAAHIEAIKRRVLDSGVLHREEVPISSKRIVRWYDLSVQPQRVGGAIIGIIATAADITESKHAQDALRQSETDFLDFEDYWKPFLGRSGPAPSPNTSLIRGLTISQPSGVMDLVVDEIRFQ